MAVRDIFKVSRKTFFNPSAWLDYQALVNQNKIIWGIISGLKERPEVGESETFDEAMKRQQLTEKDIQDGIGTYRGLALVFVILSVSSLAYAFYLAIRHYSLTGFLLAMAVAALFGSQAFKYDFWALQMTRRQLGLTFKDWKRQYLGN
jgi:hypothetical protein